MRLLSRLLLLIFLTTSTHLAFAGEGMWLPLLLKALNEEEMRGMGMKMTAEDIYSVNQGSLKDAIVHFGGFCTGEIVSDQGLLLTNHHCGYGQIQQHTTLENNYLEDGFWAMSRGEEKANPGLYAKFIERIEDVTEAALRGITEGMTKEERQSLIDRNLKRLEDTLERKPHEEVAVRPFFKGNQYFAFITVTYPDVRLVGAPPSSIGKFGADTDNWVWPRHTGDFSLFRVYAGPDNLPAEYSENNVPLRPKHHLPVSLDGVAPDDFTLIFGFPGRTNQYLPSYAVDQLMRLEDPAKIAVREAALDVLDAEMKADPAIKIKYAGKFASIANYWKKWIGEVQGLERSGGLLRKRNYEAEFAKRLTADPTLQTDYGDLLPEMQRLYAAREALVEPRAYYGETTRNIELLRLAGLYDRLVGIYEANGAAGYDNFKARLVPYLAGQLKNYDPLVDQKVFTALMALYADKVPTDYRPAFDRKPWVEQAEKLYRKTRLNTPEGMAEIFDEKPEDAVEKILDDPAYQFYKSLSAPYNERVAAPYSELDNTINDNMRRYMAAQMAAFPERTFYPDANSTLRVGYGQVTGYEPRDGVKYQHQTHLSGVMEKYVPDDYEFDVPARLRQLYADKDYGPYATADGQMPVCFIGSNHTTGGNSGSPAIDAHGNLIGLNFDRAWEGTMSDYNYDAAICRNIMVDARYVLFIIDKYAGAGHLVEEMTLVHPKAGAATGQPVIDQLQMPGESPGKKRKRKRKRRRD